MFLLEWPGGSWEASLRIVLTILAIYFVALWTTLVFWTYRDIRQRSRDPIVQTVAVLLVLVFFLPGHWIYLILRPRYTLTELYERSLEEEALLQELEDQKACPSCNRRTQDEFLICPFCRTTLKEPCRGCSKPLSRAWLTCPFCGMEKPAPPRPAQQRSSGGAPRAPARGAQRPASNPPPRQQRRDPFARSSPDREQSTTARGSTSTTEAPRQPDAPEPSMIDATKPD